MRKKIIVALLIGLAAEGAALHCIHNAEVASREAGIEAMRQQHFILNAEALKQTQVDNVNADVDNVNIDVDRHQAVRLTEAEEPSRGARRVITVEATAYTTAEDECGKSDGITASGAKAVPGYTVAADDLPFGTRLLINGKVYEVMDRFGGDYTGRIDIHVATKEEAFAFGRRVIDVEVLD